MRATRSTPVKANDVPRGAPTDFAVAAVATAPDIVAFEVDGEVDGETVVPKTLEVLAAKSVPVPSKVAWRIGHPH